MYSEVMGVSRSGRRECDDDNFDNNLNSDVDESTGQKMSGSFFKECVDDEYFYLDADFDFENIDAYEERREKEKHDEYLRHSINRTRNSIYYLSRSNVWDWFVTLTLDPAKVDRYDYVECSKKVRKQLNNIKNRYCSDMYYLLVPEQHKDGAWHFHGLFGDCGELEFVDSSRLDAKGNTIFNIEAYKLGFSTATRVTDTERVSSYICKYITKELCDVVPGRQRYWVSNNVCRAPKYQACIDDWNYQRFFEHFLSASDFYKMSRNEFCNVHYFEVADLPEGVVVDD